MRRGPCEFCVMAPICKSEEVACGLFAQFVLQGERRIPDEDRVRRPNKAWFEEIFIKPIENEPCVF
jgi:hypothetical protein